MIRPKKRAILFFLEKQNNMNARIFHPGKIEGFEKRRGQIPNPNPKVCGCLTLVLRKNVRENSKIASFWREETGKGAGFAKIILK